MECPVVLRRSRLLRPTIAPMCQPAVQDAHRSARRSMGDVLAAEFDSGFELLADEPGLRLTRLSCNILHHPSSNKNSGPLRLPRL